MSNLETAISRLINTGYSVTLSPSPDDSSNMKIKLSKDEQYHTVTCPKKVMFDPAGGALGVELMLIKQDFEESEAE